ncbi:MAG: LysM peptidoglycan-binding domain-containing protein [Actinomycetota bacterium]|nr:LysM peptidoglycan-binding domain-containing protein [Actinomycetota bacterium]
MSSRASALSAVVTRLSRPLAFLALVAVVIGIPAALIGIGGSPLPGGLPSWHDVTTALSSPDDGTLFAGLLLLLAWGGWALFTLTVLIELLARLRGRPAPKLPALRVPQAAAAALVGLLFAAGPQMASAGIETTAAPVVVSASFAVDATASAVPVAHAVPVAPAVPATPAARAVPAAPAEAATRTYVVRDGDSLWSIAERELGDGRRFAAIAKLNYGVPQPDGRVLENSHWIQPGWTLKLPSEPVHFSAHGSIYTVQPGDSLWSIARDQLGDPGRRDEIAEASRGLAQRDGRHLTDPDVIEVGWTLAIPGTPPAQAAPQQPSTAVAPVAPHVAVPPAPHVAVPPVAPVIPLDRPHIAVPPEPDIPAASVVPAAPVSTDVLAGEVASAAWTLDDAREVMPVRTTAGLGALLAAGIIAMLAARRSGQQRRRRHGRPIPMPVGGAAEAERELRVTADPLGIETVDRALRTLAAYCARTGQSLPVVRAARLTPEQFDLYLAEPAELPSPWAGTADSLVWTLPAEVPGLLPETEARQVAAPYPSLVIIGHDQEDGHVFLDLEHVGALGVAGDSDRTSEVLAAIAVELSISRWADDLQVTIVGAYPELEDALETGRIRYLPAVGHLIDELTVRADEDRSILAVAGVHDLNHARAEGAASGTWTPEIVLLAGHITSHQRYQLGRLIDQLPRVAIAAVVNGEPVGEWCLRLTDDTAILEPMGLQIRPQRIDDQTYGKILDLMSIAATDASPSGDEVPEPAVTDLPAAVSEDVIDLAAVAAAESSRLEPPRLLVLGPVDVVDANGPVEPSKKSRLTELFAYLAFHPGSDFSVIDAAVWPGARTSPNTRNTAMSKLRRWLGTDASGADYLPRHQAETGYRLGDAVRSDWDVWCALLPSGAVGAEPEDLERALRLVRGRPFDGVRVHRYAWAENLKQTMISAIVDASYELARRRLMEGRWRATEQAIVVGLSLEPGMERLWRVRILAAHASGNPAAEKEAINRMLSVTDDLGGDLEPETEQLLRELRDPTVPARERLAFHAI